MVKQYLSETNEDIHLESFPGYAPELNPDEGIWNHLKRVELKNLCCQTLPELRAHLHRAALTAEKTGDSGLYQTNWITLGNTARISIFRGQEGLHDE